MAPAQAVYLYSTYHHRTSCFLPLVGSLANPSFHFPRRIAFRVYVWVHFYQHEADFAFHPWSLAKGIECSGGKAMAQEGDGEVEYDGEEEDWEFDDNDLQGTDGTQVTRLLTCTVIRECTCRASALRWQMAHAFALLCWFDRDLVRHEYLPPWSTMSTR